MQEQRRQGNSRKSLRKSQTIRYCVNTETLLLGLLLFVFLFCIYHRASQKTRAQEQYSFPIKYQQQNDTLTINAFQQLDGKQSSIERQIGQYCQDMKCHPQQIKILYLIGNMMKQQIVTEYTIPNIVEQIKQVEQQTLLPQKLQTEQNRPKNIENLIEYTLTAAEHEQLTTPLTKHSNLLTLFNLFQTYHPYEGVNCLFKDCQVLWQPQIQNGLLTVQAEEKIRPNLIEIESKAESSTKMEVIGLVISPTNELLGLHLGSFQLNPGINWLHCKKSHCLQEYSMVLFKIHTMKLSKLKIYRKMIF